jgi:hypothetical protein
LKHLLSATQLLQGVKMKPKSHMYGETPGEKPIKELIAAREITQEIINFGVSEQQIQQIIYLLALELENREMMLQIIGVVKKIPEEIVSEKFDSPKVII